MVMMDTSALIHIINGTEIGIRIVEKYDSEFNSISGINVHEVMVGANLKNKVEIRNFLNGFEIIPFENGFRSAELQEKLKKKGKMMEFQDILIASICLEQGIPLITTDKGFQNIDELQVILVK